jgi:hypothetical protein
LHQAFAIKKKLYLIMEYAGGGELSDWVKKQEGLSEV